MADETEIDTTVNSILSQLKDVPVVAKKVQKTTEPLDKDALEKFVVDYTSRLIENATESVESIKDSVQSAPTAEDVTSLAELIKSTSTALEVLNKIVINNKKNENSITIKTMDIDSKREQLDIKTNTLLIASREEMMNQLFKKSKTIEAEIVND
jgi:hypothetical protein